MAHISNAQQSHVPNGKGIFFLIKLTFFASTLQGQARTDHLMAMVLPAQIQNSVIITKTKDINILQTIGYLRK